MMLNPEAREIVRQAALEAFTRHLTAEEIWLETVRLCRAARTPEEIEAAGGLVGRVAGLAKMIKAAAEAGAAVPEPDGPEPGGAVAGPEPDVADEQAA